MSSSDVPVRNAALAHRVIDQVVASGCVGFVVSPGSRNTPLVMAAANTGLPIEVVLDERGAGFFALGWARAACAPVALICTSGTAGANYFPSIIEAWESGVPLVAITADRPPEEQRIGAPQTTLQHSFYAEHVKGRWLLGAADDPEAVDGLPDLRRVLASAIHGKPGPVHLNIGFREPLYEAVPHLVEKAEPFTPAQQLDHALPDLPDVARGLVVVGPVVEAAPEARQAAQAMADLATARGWPVLADIASGLRHEPRNDRIIVNKYDLFLRSAGGRAALAPEFVLHVGRMPTSKTLFTWLRELEDDGTAVWNVSSDGEPHSLARAPTRIVCDWAALADYANDARGDWPGRDEGWLEQWRLAEHHATREVVAQAGEAGLWEGHVAACAARLPDRSRLVLASGMAIRDMETYANALPPGGECIVNRGVNGIDGLVATAAGVASEDPGRHVRLVIGDLALQHDIGSLALAAGQDNLDIVVINNGGGGIFEFLPIRNQTGQFERFFLAPQSASLADIAAGFGIASCRCEMPDELESLLSETRSGCRVIEVIVAREHNVAVHKRIGSQVTAIIDKKFPLESIDGKRRDAAQGGVEPG